jgi:hypothetical protein
MADALFVLVCLANQTGVDPTAAIQRNIAKKTGRDKERHANNPKLKGGDKKGAERFNFPNETTLPQQLVSR